MGIGHEVVVRKPTPEQTFAHTRWELVALPGKDGRPACILGMGLEITNFVDDLSHTNTRIKQMKFTQSHILRKPVANILGILNVLDRGHMPEESQHLLDQLHQSAIELDEIIKELAKI
ncbi:MAG: hypothetical protein EBZ77_01420 [Chitinophagia bacterium]|nr:hypothetical protein [Chitinophagia bacterium]